MHKEISKSLEISVASNLDQMCSAFHLVYTRYIKLGYTNPHPSEMRFLLRDFLPNSTIIVAHKGNKSVATLTNYAAPRKHLAEGHLFSDEIIKLGKSDDLVMETTKFAVANENHRLKISLTLMLFKYFYHWAKLNNVESIVIVVNPKHTSFYQSTVDFEVVGEPKSYSNVCNNPGVLMRLPVREIETGHRQLSRSAKKVLIDKNLDNNSKLENYSISEHELALLLLENSEPFQQATPTEAKEFAKHFPRIWAMYEAGVCLEDSHSTKIYSPATLSLKICNIKSLINQLTSALRWRTRARNIRLECFTDKHIPDQIIIDPTAILCLLESNIQMLINNTEDSSTIYLDVLLQNNILRITLSCKKELHLARQFSRIHNTNCSYEDNRCTMQEIPALLGGSISLENYSTASKGSSIVFELPCIKPDTKTPKLNPNSVLWIKSEAKFGLPQTLQRIQKHINK